MNYFERGEGIFHITLWFQWFLNHITWFFTPSSLDPPFARPIIIIKTPYISFSIIFRFNIVNLHFKVNNIGDCRTKFGFTIGHERQGVETIFGIVVDSCRIQTTAFHRCSRNSAVAEQSPNTHNGQFRSYSCERLVTANEDG